MAARGLNKYMDHFISKCALCQVQKAKAPISLHVHAVLSDPSLAAYIKQFILTDPQHAEHSLWPNCVAEQTGNVCGDTTNFVCDTGSNSLSKVKACTLPKYICLNVLNKIGKWVTQERPQ